MFRANPIFPSAGDLRRDINSPPITFIQGFTLFDLSCLVFPFDLPSMFYQRSNPEETVRRRVDTSYRSIGIVISRNYSSLFSLFSFFFISRVVRSSSFGLYRSKLVGQIDDRSERYLLDWIESYS